MLKKKEDFMKISLLIIGILMFILHSQSLFAGKIIFDWPQVGASRILMMDDDGKNVQNLTNEGFHGAISPNGKNIVFSSERDGNYEIYIMDNDGKNQTRLTNTPGNELFPSWSPDGKRIAFINGEKTGFDIFIVNVDGTNLVNLTKSVEEEFFPAWSPDGRKIAFVLREVNTFFEKIYIMNTDGGGRRKLTMFEEPNIAEGISAWSSDGNWIAFFRGESIYIIHPDGKEERRLLQLPDHPGFGYISWFQLGYFHAIQPEGRLTNTWGWIKE
jgi:TolB protein